MNYSLIAYQALELLILCALGFFYFMMGRNKRPVYQKSREKLEEIVPFFKGNFIYYLSTIILLLVAFVRARELINTF